MPTKLVEMAERGERIYNEEYRDEYEARYNGQFVAIDLATKAAYVAASPEDALQTARDKSSSGVFHLIRVGSPGVYRVAHTGTAERGDWLLGQ